MNRIVEEAACSGLDPEIWFDVITPLAAKQVCGKCPVRELCLRVFRGEEYGIFGGLTPRERRIR